MSHRATNWAIQQRGLEPATKLLLWQLADRHNGDTGRCDPSQARLADDCEMSRATVNRHLKKLEERGLIRRVPPKSDKNQKQQTTSYLLALDHEFDVSQNETNPVSQRRDTTCVSGETRPVSNCDTNPVREPVREPGKLSGLDFLIDLIGKELADDFAQHCRESRKPLTDLRAKKIAKQLEPFSAKERAERVERAIANGWTGVVYGGDTAKRREMDPTVAYAMRMAGESPQVERDANGKKRRQDPTVAQALGMAGGGA